MQTRTSLERRILSTIKQSHVSLDHLSKAQQNTLNEVLEANTDVNVVLKDECKHQPTAKEGGFRENKND